MARPYVPDAGDIVWISFSPQAGHEQAGHRPAVVLSPAAYNAKTISWPSATSRYHTGAADIRCSTAALLRRQEDCQPCVMNDLLATIVITDPDLGIGSFQNLCRVDDRGEFLVKIAESRGMNRFRRTQCPVQGRPREGRSRIGNHVSLETQISCHPDRS